MQDEFVVADSAGHTMIDIDAVRAADLTRSGDGEEDAKDRAADRNRRPVVTPQLRS